jgi:hypothetical protein
MTIKEPKNMNVGTFIISIVILAVVVMILFVIMWYVKHNNNNYTIQHPAALAALAHNKGLGPGMGGNSGLNPMALLGAAAYNSNNNSNKGPNFGGNNNSNNNNTNSSRIALATAAAYKTGNIGNN